MPHNIQLDAAVDHWKLALDGVPLQSTRAVVVMARWQNQDVVVKIVDSEGDEARTAAVLGHFGGRGAVRLLDHDAHALLLERLRPGHPLRTLVDAGNDDDATRELCRVLRALHAAPRLPNDFPPIEKWGLAFGRYRATGDTAVSRALVDAAEPLYMELAASQGDTRLLHGDLHHDNILWDERRGWLAIDPKGVVGESAYELGAALRNPPARPDLVGSPEVARRRATIMSEELGIDRARILAWGFVQAVLSAIWSVEDREDPSYAVLVATTLQEVARAARAPRISPFRKQ